MVSISRKTPSSNRRPVKKSSRRDPVKPEKLRKRPDSPSRIKFKKYNEIRELQALKEIYAAKDLLFKSKKDNPKKQDASEPHSVEEEKTSSPALQPVLLKEKSPWKKQTLEKNSLLHLLVLNILYARCFHRFPQGEIFDWLCDNHAFLVQDIPLEMRSQAIACVEAIETNREEIVGEIIPYLVGWDWERLPPLRQLILITAWQLIRTSPPQGVPEFLNDAINHAKWFGDDKDYAFVNSILDKLISQNRLWLKKPDRHKE